MFKNLVAWSAKEFGHLPWRKKRTLYRTLVSEIMLQQTTVTTVINHFEAFLKQYPDLHCLGLATEDEICIAWKGLGYYRRARNLLKAARDINLNHAGIIPIERDQLLKIPGIGAYTADALIAIGSDKPALAVDANIERVLSRLYGFKEKKGPRLQNKVRKLLTEKKFLRDLKKFGSRSVNEGLMDLGRVYCQSRRAECLLCPMRENCQAFRLGKPLSFPIQDKKVSKYFELSLLRVVVHKNGEILGYIKNKDEWLSGQVEVPTFILESEDRSLKQYPRLPKTKIALDDLVVIKTNITKYRIRNYVLELREKQFQKLIGDLDCYKYFNPDGQSSNLSTTTLKVLKSLE